MTAPNRFFFWEGWKIKVGMAFSLEFLTAASWTTMWGNPRSTLYQNVAYYVVLNWNAFMLICTFHFYLVFLSSAQVQVGCGY